MTRLTTLADAEAVSERAALEIVRRLQDARRERGVAHLALSGGSTPSRTYELLASDRSSGIGQPSWEGVEVWFADERASDRATSRAITGSHTRRCWDPPGSPEVSTACRASWGPSGSGELRAGAGGACRRPRRRSARARRDRARGLGPDGHVASLFPGARRWTPARRACLGVHGSPKPPPERDLALSMAVLRARAAVLPATSAAKSDAISAMLGEPSRHVPASLLRRGRLSVIVDDAAAPPAPRG